jgi:multidrug transporter EmrE-like cation transporter
LRGWVNLVAAIILLNIGNFLLDTVAKDLGISRRLFFSPAFLFSIGSLGLAFLFYVRSLRDLPLAVAYPVMVGLSLTAVALGNYYWLGAPLSPPQALGIIILFAGIVLIASCSKSRKG